MRVRLPRVESPERRLFILELDEAEAAAHAVRILHHQRFHHVAVAGEVGPQAVLSDAQPRQAADEELPGLVLRLVHHGEERFGRCRQGGGGRFGRGRDGSAVRFGNSGARGRQGRKAAAAALPRVGWVWAREV